MLTRLSGPENSQSFLDALCIRTVPKPLALSCLQSSEESSGSIHVKKSRYYGREHGMWKFVSSNGVLQFQQARVKRCRTDVTGFELAAVSM